MPDKRIALWLVDASNEFQQMLRASAEAACRAAGLACESHFSGYELDGQVSQIRAAIERPERADALLVMATRDRGLSRCIRDAARAGIAWIFLNHTEENLDGLRAEFPAMAIATVSADEKETGRIQGRQMRALVRQSGLVVYVQGSTQSLVARMRTAGMQEAIKDVPFQVSLLEADWDPAVARERIRRWLTTVAPGNSKIDLITCQNDPLAVAALEALQDVAQSSNRPDLAHVPVTGCDGTPAVGRKLVRDGKLVATVALPNWGGAAAETAAAFLLGRQLPQPERLLSPASFPPENELHALGR